MSGFAGNVTFKGNIGVNGYATGSWNDSGSGYTGSFVGNRTTSITGSFDFNADGIPDILLEYPPYLGVWCPDANGNFKQWIPMNVNLGSWTPAGN
jgi:hypothetical protein